MIVVFVVVELSMIVVINGVVSAVSVCVISSDD